jgi:hypothetical protein
MRGKGKKDPSQTKSVKKASTRESSRGMFVGSEENTWSDLISDVIKEKKHFSALHSFLSVPDPQLAIEGFARIPTRLAVPSTDNFDTIWNREFDKENVQKSEQIHFVEMLKKRINQMIVEYEAECKPIDQNLKLISLAKQFIDYLQWYEPVSQEEALDSGLLNYWMLTAADITNERHEIKAFVDKMRELERDIASLTIIDIDTVILYHTNAMNYLGTDYGRVLAQNIHDIIFLKYSNKPNNQELLGNSLKHYIENDKWPPSSSNVEITNKKEKDAPKQFYNRSIAIACKYAGITIIESDINVEIKNKYQIGNWNKFSQMYYEILQKKAHASVDIKGSPGREIVIAQVREILSEYSKAAIEKFEADLNNG